MGGNYEKSVYNQLMEVMEKLNSMESEHSREGVYRHRVEHLGTPGRAYITRYRLDLEVTPIATEIRIYADRDGNFQVPDELKVEVSYGGTVKVIAAFLHSEGVVANDRICTFINFLSGDKFHLSTGSVYGFCQKFA